MMSSNRTSRIVRHSSSTMIMPVLNGTDLSASRCGNSSATPRRLLCRFGNTGKVDTFLVQNGHLSTFEVEEIAGHFCSGALSTRVTIREPTIDRPKLQFD